MNCTKAKFTNESEAIFFIDKLKKTSKRERKPQTAYLCKRCNTWHITSIKLEVDIAMDKLKNQNKQLYNSLIKRNEKIKKLNEKIEKLEADNANLRFKYHKYMDLWLGSYSL
jgi:predicted  nucleic acid-binding Zn-ribbon protein